jgi:hypothetical protein
MDWEAVHVKGPVRAACHAERRKVETGMQIGKPEPGPPEFTRTFLLSDCGIVDAGEYELWTEYPADLYFDRTYAPTPTAKLVSSNHILVRIAAPSGTDAEVFKAHHEACNKITLSPQGLLEKYPASTYAGYALAEKVPDYSNPLFKPVPPAEQVRMSREEGKTVVAFADPAFEQYFQKLDAHVKGGNVPESLRAELYGFYGDLLIQRGRFAEAETAFCQAVKDKPADVKGEAYYERAQQFLDVLGKQAP